MALRQSVQEQNAATRKKIADLARRFREQAINFPRAFVELTARRVDAHSGILARLDVVPEQLGDFLSGYWLAADRTFTYFELQLDRGDPRSIEVEVWEVQPELKANARERGTGKNFASLALDVLDELNSRPDTKSRIAMSLISTNLQVLEQLAAAFNHHDLDGIMEHFAEDCSLDMPRGPDPWGTRYVGKAAVREGLRSRFEMLPDVHYGDVRHFATDTMGVSEWLVTGTLRSGKKIAARGCDHYELREGKVVRKDSYWKIVE